MTPKKVSPALTIVIRPVCTKVDIASTWVAHPSLLA